MLSISTATFAGGCFWCTEAIFQRLKGVTSVLSGYAGNPEAESLQITFDPQIISYSQLVEIFFATHDSTTLNRQGNDQGTQYRSVIFYHEEAQKQIAETQKAQIPNSVTEIIPFVKFYPAEDYHQNYYNTHTTAPYCQIVISPKIQKLLAKYPQLVKTSTSKTNGK